MPQMTPLAAGQSAPAARVAVVLVPDYDPGRVAEGVAECVRLLGGVDRFASPGRKILLKPNILGPFSSEKAVTTHPEVTRAVGLLFRSVGAEISVGDSPAVGSMESSMRVAGYGPLLDADGFAPADFGGGLSVDVPDNRVGKRLTLVRALAGCDAVVSLPKLKNHVQMAFTGAVKNLYGLVPGVMKGQFHVRFQDRGHLAELMVDILRAVRPALAVMDAVVGMEGDGPSGGDPRQVGLLMASEDLVALDAVACAVVGLDGGRTPIAEAARGRGVGETRLSEIEIVGETLERCRVAGFRPVSVTLDVLRVLPLPRPVLKWVRRQWAPRPFIDAGACICCGVCAKGCPLSPPAIDPGSPKGGGVDHGRCIRCYCCHEFCPEKAIRLKRSALDRALDLNRTLGRLGDWAASRVRVKGGDK